MKKKRVLCLALACAMGLSMTACGSKGGTTTDGDAAISEAGGETKDHYAISEEIYDSELGDFYAAYQEAAEETEDVAARFAKFAVAEAKLLESAVILPCTTNYGNYGITRVAYGTKDYALWGADSDRFHNCVLTNEIITAEDMLAMKEKWAELQGTGTYEEWVKSYLQEKGYTLKDTYTFVYTADPETYDTMGSFRSTVSEVLVNTYDGLVEYDMEGTMQPALAESWDISEDGLTYTFHLRQGVKWVDSQGREIGEVTADDFVAGMQHLLDAKPGSEYLAGDVIVNANEYAYGEITDFSEVGIKAVDDYTLEYTLKSPTHYFMTLLGYTAYAPMNRSYYESCGGKFGAEFDNSAADYTYGSDPDHIAYCGPYVITNATANNMIVFSQNESYWNKDNINVKTITWMFDDGSDATRVYNDVLSGALDGGGLNTSEVELAKSDGNLEKYAYIRDTDATTFANQYNLNRTAFANFNDDTKAVSPQTEEDAARTNAAINNVHFRRALSMALDRTSYNAQVVGEDVAVYSLRNTYTPGNMLTLPTETTISINGTDTTFPEGTYYGEIIQAQIDADEMPITVWDPEANDGLGSSDGYDGWYNPEAAVAELETAIEELAEEGITIDADNPIQLDIPYPSISEAYTNRNNVYKQSLETVLNGMVQVNMVSCTDMDEWYYTGYYTETADQSNFDITDVSGWSPDYGDPSTFLATFLPDGDGYMTKSNGLY